VQHTFARLAQAASARGDRLRCKCFDSASALHLHRGKRVLVPIRLGCNAQLAVLAEEIQG
jgi:hypothetical protein